MMIVTHVMRVASQTECPVVMLDGRVRVDVRSESVPEGMAALIQELDT